MIALDTALSVALSGIAQEDTVELKSTFGKVMAEVVLEIINPAIKAFPELAVDDTAWRYIAIARAAARVNQS
jgi:hypothetical protein